MQFLKNHSAGLSLFSSYKNYKNYLKNNVLIALRRIYLHNLTTIKIKMIHLKYKFFSLI